LGGKETGDITLEEFASNHSSDIGTYRENTMNFPYVRPNGNRGTFLPNPYNELLNSKKLLNI